MSTGVSLKPSDAQPGGGILEALNDEDALIKLCRFTLWNYNKPDINPALFLSVTYEMANGDGDFEQKYRGGESKFLVPSPDGKEAVPVDESNRTGLPEGCNALIWLSEMVSAGFPEHLIGRDVSVFEGTKVHLNLKPQPKREGLKGGDPDKKKDILVVTKILALPGQQMSAGAGKSKSKTKAATANQTVQEATAAPVGQASNGNVTARAIEVVMEILAAKGGSVPKVAIANEAFKIMNAAKDPLRNEVSKLVFKDEFLSGGIGDVPFSYDGTTVSL